MRAAVLRSGALSGWVAPLLPLLAHEARPPTCPHLSQNDQVAYGNYLKALKKPAVLVSQCFSVGAGHASSWGAHDHGMTLSHIVLSYRIIAVQPGEVGDHKIKH